MKSGQIWSEKFDCYVSQAFMPSQAKNIKIDISKCVIKISEFGFYYLWLNGKKLKRIDFLQFQSYKNYVKEVIRDVVVYAFL